MFTEMDIEFWKAVAYTVLATIGGFLGHLMRTIDKRLKIRWGHACLEGGAAGFVGTLTLLLCRAAEFNDAWTGVIVGVFGWMGANATIKVLERVILKKLGVDLTTEEQPLRERRDDTPSD